MHGQMSMLEDISSWQLHNPSGDSTLDLMDLMGFIRRLFKDERIRRKVAACDGDRFAAMGYPRTGREELLNLSKLIAWVSGQVLFFFAFTAIDRSIQYFPWDDGLKHSFMLESTTLNDTQPSMTRQCYNNRRM